MIRHALISALLAVALAAVPAAAADEARPGDGGAQIGGSFMLQDHLGRIVRDDQFRGRYMVLYFGYTFCPDVCPTGLQALGEALDLLGEDAKRVQALFITVDPARDTPKVLRDYVAAFHPALIGLTGPKEFIDSVVAKYRVKTARVAGGGADAYTIDHTASAFLVGPDGEYIRRYPHGMAAADIAEDLRQRFAAAPQ